MKKLLLSFLVLSLVNCTSKEKINIYYKSVDGDSAKDSLTREKEMMEAKEFFSKADKIPIDSIYAEHTNLDTLQKKDSLIILYKTTFYYGKPSKEKREAEKAYDDFVNSLMKKPFFTKDLKTIEGKVFNQESLNNKPTLVNLWFTSCAPCIEEMPYLNELKNKYQNQVNFVSVTFNNKNEVESFLQKKEFNFLHIIDGKKFLDEKNVQQYPLNIFIDKKGIVQKVEANIPMTKDENGNINADLASFESEIKKLL